MSDKSSSSNCDQSSNVKDINIEKEPTLESKLKPKTPITIIICLLTGLFFLGIYDFLIALDKNDCEMTYMFQYPNYIPVSGINDDNYGLYVYGEGSYSVPYRGGQFTGIPVLFVPGNSGSHKQVRSLASVALRKALDEEVQYRFHFDYFAIDFKEEFSALYGGSLQNQSAFVSKSIQHILSLYKEDVPKSVVLIGHSIGGLVSLSALKDQNIKGKVNTIINLATPHQPVIVADYDIREFYEEVSTLWNTSLTESDPFGLKDITVISLGGGDRDVQVRSAITHFDFAQINSVVTSIPDVWLSTDHRCIAWCKQVILTLNRALFDVVDTISGQITQDKMLRENVFNYHLVNKYSVSNQFKSKDTFFRMNFDKDGFWHDGMKRQFSIDYDIVEENTHHMIKILDDPKHSTVTIRGKGILHDDWIFACQTTMISRNKRICNSGDNLSHMTNMMPSQDGLKWKTITLDMQTLKDEFKHSHVLIFIPKGAKDVTIEFDVYDVKERNVVIENLPRWITFWKSYPVIEETKSSAIFYNISLMGLEQAWQAYDLIWTPKGQCKGHSVVRMNTPWSNNDVFHFLSNVNQTSVVAKLQTMKKQDNDNVTNPGVITNLDPSCQYKVEVRASMEKIWGQIARFYWPLMLPFAVSVVLLTFAQQLKLFDGIEFPDFVLIIRSSVTPMLAVLPSKIIGAVCGISFLAAKIPKTDYVRLAEQNIDFGIQPVLLYFAAIGIITLIAILLRAIATFIGQILATDYFAGFIARQDNENQSGFPAKMLFVSSFLIVLAASTCGTIALIVETLTHFIHTIVSYSKWCQSKNNLKYASKFKFNLSLTMLWGLTSALNLPSLLAWIRHLSTTSPNLVPDPSLLIAFVFSASFPVLWKSPQNTSKTWNKTFGNVIQLLCILTLLFGCVSVYRVNYFLIATVIILCIHQLNTTKEKND